MWDTSGRLLRVLELLQQRHEWSATELAERLGVSTRTIRRDVDRLRAIGYPVEARLGVDGGYHLEPGATLPPLMFDADEAVATVLALQAFSSSPIGPADGSALRALVKLVRVMPRRLRGRIDAVVSGVRQTDAGTIRGQDAPLMSMEALVEIAAACRDRRRSTAVHATDGELLIDPLSVVRAGQRWFLVAWDVVAGKWRTLRVDRFTSFQATDRPAMPREPPSADMEGYVIQHLGREIQQVRATVRIEAPVEQVVPWIDPAFGTVEAAGQRASIVRCGADTYAAVARWILLLDAEVTVVEPAELAAEYATIAEQAADIARRYRPTG
ncbi:WYL domain-containing protein [Actinomycetes bacterium KLBMP 9759]